MEIKHTPGPWRAHTENTADYIDIDHGCTRVTSISLEVKGITYGPEEWDTPEREIAERKANANLIALAPELLEALILCERALEERDTEQEEHASKQARVAIAKATS